MAGRKLFAASQAMLLAAVLLLCLVPAHTATADEEGSVHAATPAAAPAAAAAPEEESVRSVPSATAHHDDSSPAATAATPAAPAAAPSKPKPPPATESTMDDIKLPEYESEMERLRAGAKYMRGGCSAGVQAYLRRVHTERAGLAHRVADAASAVAAVTGDGDRARSASPAFVRQQRAALEKAQQHLAIFDNATFDKYGLDAPHTCLTDYATLFGARVEAMARDPRPYHPHVQLLLSMVYHCRILARTVAGSVRHQLDAYAPAVDHLRGVAQRFSDKAHELYYQAHPKDPRQPQPPLASFVLTNLSAMCVACVPFALYAVVAAVAVALWPFLLWPTVMVDVFYHFWYRLFVLYYCFGIRSNAEVVAGLRRLWAFIAAGRYNDAFELFLDGALGVVTEYDPRAFNGLLMEMILAGALFFTAVASVMWVYYVLLPSRRRRRRHPRRHHEGEGEATAQEAPRGRKGKKN